MFPQQIDEYSNRVANLMVSEGYKHGDTVALFMMNQPEYVCTWLGCAKGILQRSRGSRTRIIPWLSRYPPIS
ncbi:Long-chain fatty acid transport protein 1 [Portunus trituberculatus]|uniref:Long-chain fatty acid transport protein 1 n=1 Tax=Portunus trituberculatus TaxID=210409 RepID=A0A5B7EKZ0_PORTR|nr:Long-chain fatty acid transport protein 1 [Portunus trituberculatus]